MPTPNYLNESVRPSRSASSIRNTIALFASAALLSATLTGCSVVTDAVVGELGNAGCAVGSSVLTQVTSDVATAVGDLAVDPVAALTALMAADAALGVALVGITAEPGATAVENARATLAQIIDLADNAVASGAKVDPEAVASLLEQFTTEITGIC